MSSSLAGVRAQVAKLCHHLDEVRDNAVTSLRFKLAQGLVAPSQIVQEADALRALLCAAAAPDTGGAGAENALRLLCALAPHAAAREWLAANGGVPALRAARARHGAESGAGAAAEELLRALFAAPGVPERDAAAAAAAAIASWTGERDASAALSGGSSGGGGCSIGASRPSLFVSAPSVSAGASAGDSGVAGASAGDSGVAVSPIARRRDAGAPARSSGGGVSYDKAAARATVAFAALAAEEAGGAGSGGGVGGGYSSDTFNAALSHAPQGFCFPWVRLSPADEAVAYDIHVHFSLREPGSLVTACRLLQHLFLPDFPAELFLQAPSVLHQLAYCLQVHLGAAGGSAAPDLLVRTRTPAPALAAADDAVFRAAAGAAGALVDGLRASLARYFDGENVPVGVREDVHARAREAAAAAAEAASWAGGGGGGSASALGVGGGSASALGGGSGGSGADRRGPVPTYPAPVVGAEGGGDGARVPGLSLAEGASVLFEAACGALVHAARVPALVALMTALLPLLRDVSPVERGVTAGRLTRHLRAVSDALAFYVPRGGPLRGPLPEPVCAIAPVAFGLLQAASPGELRAEPAGGAPAGGSASGGGGSAQTGGEAAATAVVPAALVALASHALLVRDAPFSSPTARAALLPYVRALDPHAAAELDLAGAVVQRLFDAHDAAGLAPPGCGAPRAGLDAPDARGASHRVVAALGVALEGLLYCPAPEFVARAVAAAADVAAGGGDAAESALESLLRLLDFPGERVRATAYGALRAALGDALRRAEGVSGGAAGALAGDFWLGPDLLYVVVMSGLRDATCKVRGPRARAPWHCGVTSWMCVRVFLAAAAPLCVPAQAEARAFLEGVLAAVDREPALAPRLVPLLPMLQLHAVAALPVDDVGALAFVEVLSRLVTAAHEHASPAERCAIAPLAAAARARAHTSRRMAPWRHGGGAGSRARCGSCSTRRGTCARRARGCCARSTAASPSGARACRAVSAARRAATAGVTTLMPVAAPAPVAARAARSPRRPWRTPLAASPARPRTRRPFLHPSPASRGRRAPRATRTCATCSPCCSRPPRRNTSAAPRCSS